MCLGLLSCDIECRMDAGLFQDVEDSRRVLAVRPVVKRQVDRLARAIERNLGKRGRQPLRAPLGKRVLVVDGDVRRGRREVRKVVGGKDAGRSLRLFRIRCFFLGRLLRDGLRCGLPRRGKQCDHRNRDENEETQRWAEVKFF